MGDVNLVQLLLDREDTEPNHVEVNHCSALMIACMHGYVEVGFYHDIESYSMCVGPLRSQKCWTRISYEKCLNYNNVTTY